MPRLILDPDSVKQLPETYTTVIPDDYLDVMGHMNVMWYTHLFSMSFVGLLKVLGLSNAFDTSHDGGSFALESHIRYLSEVRAGQTIRIYSRMIGRSEKRFHAMHFMTNDDKQDVSATFEIVSSYVSLSRRRTAPLPQNVAEAMDRLIDQGSELTWDAPVSGIMSA